MKVRFGLVVPSLGLRRDSLFESLSSSRSFGVDELVVVIPFENTADFRSDLAEHFPEIRFVNDEGKGLAAAINNGVQNLDSKCTYVSWLGDDDKLQARREVVEQAVNSASIPPTFLYGGCNYVTEDGEVLFTNRSSRFAVSFSKVFVNTIPQPGSWFCRNDWDRLGGLDESLRLAFDLDLFLRMSSLGRPVFVNQVLADFGWHQGSLTANLRSKSHRESMEARQRNASKPLRLLLLFSEPANGIATRIFGYLISRNRERKL